MVIKRNFLFMVGLLGLLVFITSNRNASAFTELVGDALSYECDVLPGEATPAWRYNTGTSAGKMSTDGNLVTVAGWPLYDGLRAPLPATGYTQPPYSEVGEAMTLELKIKVTGTQSQIQLITWSTSGYQMNIVMTRQGIIVYNIPDAPSGNMTYLVDLSLTPVQIRFVIAENKISLYVEDGVGDTGIKDKLLGGNGAKAATNSFDFYGNAAGSSGTSCVMDYFRVASGAQHVGGVEPPVTATRGDWSIYE